MQTVRIRNVVVAMALAAPGLAGIGCAAHPWAEAPPMVSRVSSPRSPIPEVADNAALIAEDLRVACNIGEAVDAPRFRSGSARLQAPDRRALRDLAWCLTRGPLRGESVALTGRADARGDSRSNLELGQRRALTVARYLHRFGVPRQAITITSRGEADAISQDVATRAFDRRVDIASGGRLIHRE